MDFTFGIITNGKEDKNINTIIKSIQDENIENYEIIIVGNSNISNSFTTVIPFDENIKNGWITKKKNIITESAKYENVVYAHDYVCLCPGWYKGFVSYGDDFNVCMTKILTNGKRYRDWTLDVMANVVPIVGEENRYARLLPYDELSLSKYMYISGAYWVAKKEFMKKFPLRETLVWGEAEDIEWSHRVRAHSNFSMNSNSAVKLLKNKPPSYTEIPRDKLELLKTPAAQKIIEEHAEKYYKNLYGVPARENDIS